MVISIEQKCFAVPTPSRLSSRILLFHKLVSIGFPYQCESPNVFPINPISPEVRRKLQATQARNTELLHSLHKKRSVKPRG